MSIGQNIKKLRESKNLTQEQLGKIIGISDKAISTWENDIKTPRMGAIEKLCAFFNVSKSKLLDDSPQADISDEAVMFALFDNNEDITPEMYEDVKRYARFIMEQKKAKEHKDSK